MTIATRSRAFAASSSCENGNVHILSLWVSDYNYDCNIHIAIEYCIIILCPIMYFLYIPYQTFQDEYPSSRPYP